MKETKKGLCTTKTRSASKICLRAFKNTSNIKPTSDHNRSTRVRLWLSIRQ